MESISRERLTAVSAEGEFSSLICRLLILGKAAQLHVDAFYPALDSARKTITSFYYPSTELPDGKHVPSIIYNGNPFFDGQGMENVFQQMLPTHHEIQSFDCQVVNDRHFLDGQAGETLPRSKNISILVVVSGSIKIGEPKHSEVKGFSESFVLVPNLEAFRKKPSRQEKQFLITSQSFRYVT